MHFHVTSTERYMATARAQIRIGAASTMCPMGAASDVVETRAMQQQSVVHVVIWVGLHLGGSGGRQMRACTTCCMALGGYVPRMGSRCHAAAMGVHQWGGSCPVNEASAAC